MDIPILFEDNHLLVVEKPVNIPVQRDSTGDLDLLTLLKQDLKVRYEKPGNVYLGLVHRLDRPVGGIMVFAKTSKAASRLSDEIRRRSMERKYLAVVRGALPRKQGVLEHYLYKDQRKNIVYTVQSTDKNGKQAILEYEVIEQNGDFSLLTINILTGRSHQIRVQLSASGYPLFGDQKYGQALNKPGQQIALWAHSLKFTHPIKKEIVEFQSFPPKEYPWNMWS
ncbi:RluA family pseudouridine synthase [Bacillus sp. FJAT-49711]|uniref:RluA family pseudouridine synthase n=1 Tax=Bacillus sp. FJAT-49711 TaxID=2833585 RepID=UPI001BC9FA97|nr:RluA family pseudouridine synthase [Bacillus sp. FJAT-49711]MBS4220463.1 RluA family pseudouridine synthase [Bacillus sp. FJAT-49711]